MWSLILSAAISAPITPNDVIEAAVIDLATIPATDRPWTRYLSVWPHSPSDSGSLSSSSAFWLNSLSWSPKTAPIVLVADGSLLRLNLRDLGWRREQWETVAADDPYFAVTVNLKGKLHRGWLDPKTEQALRYETGSTRAVLRADWFLARSSLDGEKGFFKGFYSVLLGLPGTEKELLTILGAKEEQALGKSTAFNKLFLLRGGAITQSIVAQHNRGIELLPTLVGGQQRFLWRSLDTDSDAGDASVFGKLGGSLKVAGKEFIFSLPNGLHGYYATNGAGTQVREVPSNVAQDKTHPHDVTVFVGFKCVRCHGPNGGINGFDDAIRRLQIARKTGVAIISKGEQYGDDEFRQKIEAYYAGDLGEDTKLHRAEYTRRIKDVANLDVTENTKQYLGWVERYLWGRVDLTTAIQESGMGDDTEKYLKLTSPSPLVPLLAGETISRELWEANYHRLMQAKIWEWETKP